jgi:WD40 repeat protein
VESDLTRNQEQLDHAFENEMAQIHDLKRLLLAFGSLIADHALQLYDSAMVFVPHGTALFQQYGNYSQQTCRMLNPRLQWSPLLSTMNVHAEAVLSVCFSPDGTRLASCSSDKTVRLCDAHTGSAVGEAMTGHTSFVHSICFSPDGTRLASCSDDKTVRLWDAHTGSAVGEAMTGHTDWVRAICFSPDGARLASCSLDETVRLWDARTGVAAIGEAMAGHTGWVIDICFSPDGTRLASFSRDYTIRLWDAHTGSAIGVVPIPHECFTPMFLSEGLLLVGTFTKEILFWNLQSIALVDFLSVDIVFEPQLSLLSAVVDQSGWLCVNDRRRLWIPDQCCGLVQGFRRVGEVCVTLCLGGQSGSVTFLPLLDT